MTSSEHEAEAERLLNASIDASLHATVHNGYARLAPTLAQQAQVHATLAILKQGR